MSDPLARLVGELSRLPGIGPKTATRLAHFLLKVPVAEAEALATAILEVKAKLFHCSVCNSITAVDPCRYCSDPQRDRTCICVIEEAFNLEPIERTGEFHGLYHVLMGALSPHRGIGRTGWPSRASWNGWRGSRRSSSPPTPTSRGRRPPSTWRGC